MLLLFVCLGPVGVSQGNGLRDKLRDEKWGRVQGDPRRKRESLGEEEPRTREGGQGLGSIERQELERGGQNSREFLLCL